MTSILSALFKASSLINSVKPLFVQSEKSMIGEVVINAAQVEVIDYGAKITSFPIQSKEAITDHILNEPLKIKVEGSISDSSIMFMGILEMPLQNNSLARINNNFKSLLPFNQKDSPSKKAYEGLMHIYRNKQLVNVVCKLDAFNDMAIEKLEFTADERTGEQLQFVAEMRKIKLAYVKTEQSNRVVKNEKVQALTAEKVDLGAVELKTEEVPVKTESKLRKACNYFTG